MAVTRALGRALGALQEKGIVELRRRRIRTGDLRALRRIAKRER